MPDRDDPDFAALREPQDGPGGPPADPTATEDGADPADAAAPARRRPTLHLRID